MNIETLVRMANQVGTFFEAMPDRDEALADIAAHLRRFWAPRMRSVLLAHVDAGEAPDLIPIVQAALREHRQQLL
ncbi:formate dehydrogenase subunit delta [Cupriavidus respiraculi]|uniref:formate dehydrogenase subunit delta n=1 Tax=Cupriavidus respiraculi TaxID=195930 RepID=UPI001C94D1D0|nr:formate dehydrogenase subunit delta [Cupriavidus respiraculi]MBY4945163.1 formate dehydrogenase subunit delta [Cupriavidus respiraculi]